MLNTQYTSRNEDANVNSSFAKVKEDHCLNKGNHQSREDLRNNIIVEDEKEINYSTSNYSTQRKSSNSKLRAEHSDKRINDNTQLQSKEKSFSKDLVEQMKEKIKKKQRNSKFENGELSKILVLGSSKLEDSYKNIEYNERTGGLNHNISSFNQQKQSKKVTSLGRSPNSKKNSLYSKSLYGHESSNTLSRMTRDSFNKKINLKEIILADSGSYISSMGNTNLSKHPLDQKLHLLQRESMSRGSMLKPPGTSGGRAPLHFGVDEIHNK